MFNSRSRKYRDPLGAVADGTSIHFRITLPRELSCSAANLIIQREGGQTQVLDLFWCGMNGNSQEWWECHFTPETPGLYFYHFEVRTQRGSQRISKGFAGDGIFGGNTTNAIRDAQEQAGMEVTGVADNAFQQYIFSSSAQAAN